MKLYMQSQDPAGKTHVLVPVVHNGRYTITSPRGTHRTVQIKTAQGGKLDGKRIVSLLVGPSNVHDYVGFGFVDNFGIAVWRSKSGQSYSDDQSTSKYDDIAKVLWSLATEKEMSPWYALGMRLLCEGTCVKCNRPLTDPTSIELGIGPFCRGDI